MPSDLHIHTTFSDGRLSPEEVLDAAKEAGLTYIAITDHDTVDGIRHLYEQGLYPAKTLCIIPGIEFSTEVDGHDVHVLGYDLDIYNQELLDKITELSEARWTRFSQILGKLTDIGVDITESDVLQIAGVSHSIGRAHVARALVKKGIVSTIREAFDSFLQHGCPAYVPHYKIQPNEAVDLIRGAGGVPVLAHPKLVGDDRLVEHLLSLPFGGIEVFYPRHDEEDTARYKDIAKAHGLLMTGGSDFHGVATRFPEKLGIVTIEDDFAKPFFHPPKVLD